MLMDALSPLVTTTEPELIMTDGELLILTKSSLAAVTAAESVKSVMRIGQAAAGQAAIP